ncbi:hypothetical protein [Tenacibaculum sp. 190524A02b]|uniref:hypothetical protein n=1 Tax=Tenacibaculum vairaonense TaxID=3137860 RepID=UPI0032B235C5
MKKLVCYGNQLTELDLSSNTVLEGINCNSTPELEVVNLSNGDNGNITEMKAFVGTPVLTCI